MFHIDDLLDEIERKYRSLGPSYQRDTYYFNKIRNLDPQGMDLVFGMVLAEYADNGTFSPEKIRKGSVHNNVIDALRKIKNVIRSKVCDKPIITDVEKGVLIGYLINELSESMDWEKGVILLSSAFLVRRFGLKLVDWICKDDDSILEEIKKSFYM